MDNQQQQRGQGPAFTKSYAAAAPLLHEAGVTANERLVYDALTRWSKTNKACIASRPHKDIAAETGLDEKYVGELLKNLRNRRNFTWNGEKIPVLKLVRAGRRGHTTSYRDNIAACVLSQYEDLPAMASGTNGLQRGKGPAFTKSYAAAAPKLHEAGVTASERLVYDFVARACENRKYQADYRPEKIAAETGLTEGNVRVLMCRLKRRSFDWNGVEVYVIEEIVSKSGRTIYRVNLIAWVYNPDEDPLTFL